ncbi:hypothetical protein C723_1764 [Christiangramia flava JLT2011]|nr:hypothetical protein C723_1764 [Christiangramia flava JLT2011]
MKYSFPLLIWFQTKATFALLKNVHVAPLFGFLVRSQSSLRQSLYLVTNLLHLPFLPLCCSAIQKLEFLDYSFQLPEYRMLNLVHLLPRKRKKQILLKLYISFCSSF